MTPEEWGRKAEEECDLALGATHNARRAAQLGIVQRLFAKAVAEAYEDAAKICDGLSEYFQDETYDEAAKRIREKAKAVQGSTEGRQE